jgi:hypothetical protein
MEAAKAQNRIVEPQEEDKDEEELGNETTDSFQLDKIYLYVKFHDLGQMKSS